MQSEQRDSDKNISTAIFNSLKQSLARDAETIPNENELQPQQTISIHPATLPNRTLNTVSLPFEYWVVILKAEVQAEAQRERLSKKIPILRFIKHHVQKILSLTAKLIKH